MMSGSAQVELRIFNVYKYYHSTYQVLCQGDMLHACMEIGLLVALWKENHDLLVNFMTQSPGGRISAGYHSTLSCTV